MRNQMNRNSGSDAIVISTSSDSKALKAAIKSTS